MAILCGPRNRIKGVSFGNATTLPCYFEENLQSHETAIPEEDEYLRDLTLSKGRFQIPFDRSRDGPDWFTYSIRQVNSRISYSRSFESSKKDNQRSQVLQQDLKQVFTELWGDGYSYHRHSMKRVFTELLNAECTDSFDDFDFDNL